MGGRTVAASAQALPVPSYWKNQRGSEMKIYSIDADGNFRGVYINHAVGYRCQNSPYDVVGRASGSRVVFKVVWKNWIEDCKSSTVWRGRVSGATIATRWVLTHQSGVMRGTDVFQRR